MRDELAGAMLTMCQEDSKSAGFKAYALWRLAAGSKDTAAWLGKRFGVNVRTAQRHMVRLEQLGYAERSPNTWGHEVVWQKGPKLR